LEEATIGGLQSALGRGETTVRALVEASLARIEALDRAGPAIRSIIEANPEALALADHLDAERRAGRLRGPLHGIPVVLKDNINTGDRMLTTAGSLALADRPVANDAFLVARLRGAGAVILAKANLSEWANFRSNRSTSGWSARGGLTRNPYVLDRNPCGSSSGSAAAVAASLAVVAVGTETDGSIVCPATACGIVGVKPTLGLVSRSGVIPIAHSQDTAGPMARTVRDAAILLGAIAGPDTRDPATAFAARHAEADYTRHLRADGLRGTRIGVARNFFGFHPGVEVVMERALDAITEAGGVLVDPAPVPRADDYGDDELEVLLYEFRADLETYLAGRASGPRTLADLIAFNRRESEREMPWFGQELFERAVKKGSLQERHYRDALARCRRFSREEGLDAVLRRLRLDALVAPTGGPAWVTDLVNGDHFSGGCSTPSAVAGYPHVTVPAGFVGALPVGLSFLGAAWSEPKLLRLAYAFELVTGARQPPRFLPTVSAGN
ncbi:MAG: amidase, partial [Gemmatimonadales bacterium]